MVTPRVLLVAVRYARLPMFIRVGTNLLGLSMAFDLPFTANILRTLAELLSTVPSGSVEMRTLAAVACKTISQEMADQLIDHDPLLAVHDPLLAVHRPALSLILMASEAYRVLYSRQLLVT
jgi:hypothetical protein